MVFKKGEKSKNWKGFKKGHTSWLKGTKGLVKSHMNGRTKENGKYPEHMGFQKSNKFGRAKKTWNKGLKGEGNSMFGKQHTSNAKEKMSLFRTGRCGEKSGNWKGGISNIKKLIRSMPDYFKWRSDVFQRDNWTCQTCRKRGIYLEAHHKIELNRIVKEYQIKNILDARECKELWDLDNGVTLCSGCHNLTKRGRENAV